MNAPDYPIPLVAWTGGDTPRGADIGDRRAPVFRAMRRVLFREQVDTWREAWGDSPDRDTLRTFHKRATLDAWRSYREHVAEGERMRGRAHVVASFRRGTLRSGDVSAYALRCGGVQSCERDGPNGWRVELYREHNTYHVRTFDYAKRDAGAPLATWRTWQSFPLSELKQARAHYRREVKRQRGDR